MHTERNMKETQVLQVNFKTKQTVMMSYNLTDAAINIKQAILSSNLSGKTATQYQSIGDQTI